MTGGTVRDLISVRLLQSGYPLSFRVHVEQAKDPLRSFSAEKKIADSIRGP